MKIEKTLWFTPMTGGTIGIVLGKDDITEEKKGYIGVCSGTNETANQIHIARTGQKISLAVMKEIIGYLTPGKK